MPKASTYLINAHGTVVVVGEEHDPAHGTIGADHEDEYREAGYRDLGGDEVAPVQAWELAEMRVGPHDELPYIRRDILSARATMRLPGDLNFT